MRRALRAQFNTVGFFVGFALIVAAVATVCVPGALATAGAGLCAVFGLRAAKAPR